MHRIGSVVIAGVLLGALAGCSGAASAGAQHPAASPPASPSSTPKPVAKPKPAANLGPNFQKIRQDGTKSFGHYYLLTGSESAKPDFSKNLIVQVDDAGVFHPSTDAYVDGKAKTVEKYKVTVINNSPYAQNMNLLSTSATDGDADAATVTDVAAGIGNAPTTPVRPGKTVHWFVAYGNDAHDQAVSVDATMKGDGGELVGGAGALLWSK